ncbi:hypothetical protein ABBQ32_010284 [Trebouxia sp. C0010 RCD-2024]
MHSSMTVVTAPPLLWLGQKHTFDGPATKFKKKQSNGSGFKRNIQGEAARTDGKIEC